MAKQVKNTYCIIRNNKDVPTVFKYCTLGMLMSELKLQTDWVSVTKLAK